MNDHSPRGNVDVNDGTLYTRDHYIASLKVYLDRCQRAGKNVIVDLPLAQVWDSTDWAPGEWIPHIVEAVHRHPAVAAFYSADEPEIWGYTEVNTSPKIPYQLLVERYRAVKAITDIPVLVVMADSTLIRQRYGEHLNPGSRFFDWFGFDNYPFSRNRKLDWARVDHQLNEMHTIWKQFGSPPLVYVGQGCGDTDPRGNATFGQRNPTSEELDEMFSRVLGVFGEPHTYLLWSWHYADAYMRTLGNVHLESITTVAAKTPEHWLRRLLWRLLRI